LEEFHEMLAYHYYEGQDWSKALEYLGKAGDKSTAAYANQEALEYYARALEVCESLGSSAAAASAELAKKRGLVNATIVNFREAIADFNRMRTVASSAADGQLEALSLAYCGWAQHQNHEPQAAEKTLKAALALADGGFDDVRFFASAALGTMFLVYNRHTEAEPLMDEAENLASGIDDPFVKGWWSASGSSRALWQGRFDDALEHITHWYAAAKGHGVTFLNNSWTESLARIGKGEYEQALALLQDVIETARRMGNLWFQARALNTMGWLCSELQDHRQAMDWNAEGVEVAKKANAPNPECENNARLNLGDNLLALGRMEEAEEHFQTVEQIVRKPRPQDLFLLWRYSQHLFHSYGELCLVRSQLDKALACADECLALAEQSKSRKNMVKGRRLRGQVFLRQGKLEETEREISIALKMAQRVGNPTQLWKTHAFLGEVCEAQGRSDEARGAYCDALSVIKEVADGLKNKPLKETLLRSHQVLDIRQKVQM
jgi:tetratricopeptide (TPR) repeat protein